MSDPAPDHAGGRDPPAGDPAELALELRGELPCVRCRYDLRGLSILGACPECGTPVRATLLAIVDPLAREFEPVMRPRLLVAALMSWSLGALAAAGLLWWIRIEEYARPVLAAAPAPPWRTAAAVACIGASGVGAAALVRPHGRLPRWQIAAAAGAVALYAPLIAVEWWLLAGLPSPYAGAWVPEGERVLASVARLSAAAIIIAILTGLRPNARMLAARSLLLRTGRVDRQRLLAMAGAVAVAAAGNVLHLFAPALQGRTAEIAATTATLLAAVGWMLFTIGLVGVVVDLARLCPVLLEPPPTLAEVVAGRPGGRRGSAG